MKKKVLIPIILVLLCLVGGGIACWFSLEANAFSAERFPAETTINGVDCGGMTIDEANAALTDEWNSRKFTFTRKSSELGSITLNDMTYKITEPLKNIRKDNFIKTAMNYFFDKPLELTMEMPVSHVGTAFQNDLQQAEFLKSKNPIETKDAYLDLTGNQATIVPEVYGNNIDYKSLTREICSLIETDQFKMEYKKKTFYVKPSVTADDENLTEREKAYKKYLTSKVTYIMGQDKVMISPADLAKIRGVEVSATGPMTEDEINMLKKAYENNTVNDEAVAEYVKSFAEKYNTLGKERNFTSIGGNTIKVSGGDYGFFLDIDKETSQLLTDLKSNEKVERKPIWKIEGFVEYNINDDIGDTYVEISITRQRLWYYKDGKKLVETPVVTGNPYQGYSTPTGTFSLTYKDRGATLRGKNADGTEYESEVSYWMPFYGNYGMHDAPWRGSFGGRIYRGNGSHGCVNMPVAAARKVFENIASSNVPVIVYY